MSALLKLLRTKDLAYLDRHPLDARLDRWWAYVDASYREQALREGWMIKSKDDGMYRIFMYVHPPEQENPVPIRNELGEICP